MSCHSCKDIKFNEDVFAVYFDGTSSSILSLQRLLSGTNQLNMNTLHTKLNWWAVKYSDGSIIWKRNKCFAAGYKIIK